MTVQLVLPGVLADLVGGSRHLDVDIAGTLGDVFDKVAVEHPLLERRIRDEAGVLRRFVNVYVDGEDVRHDQGLSTAVREGAVIQVLPSVAGG